MGTQHIPARGRKQGTFNHLRRSYLTQHIPARGRKLKRGQKFVTIQNRHNTSPPGDGDGLVAPSEIAAQRHNTSPPGDGDLSAVSSCPCASTQHIPARGRKHFGLNVFLRCFRRTHHIPARGRKPGRGFSRDCRSRDTTHPRQGTETKTPARPAWCIP